MEYQVILTLRTEQPPIDLEYLRRTLPELLKVLGWDLGCEIEVTQVSEPYDLK